ncbi:MAG TPA: GerMN domain-containing protein [Rectinemataceae bacterium]|nr:GerMN domain-containing protein [Rectinemataceae bacterium]
MASRKKKSSRGSNAGCLILLAGLIILVVIFAVKFPDIKATLDKTNFLNLVKQRVTTTVPNKSGEAQDLSPSSTTGRTIAVPSAEEPSSVPSTSARPSATVAPAPEARPFLPDAPQPASSAPAASKTARQPVEAKPGVGQASDVQVRQATLFFVKIEDDGVISRREVKRSIPASDSPLGDAISALISGPSEGEIRSGLVSLIPRGTKLLGITLRGSTAIIDLSEPFMYNHYGVEGFSAQLRQIVYTATSFPSVQDVQILVEGKLKEYLGGEGVYIGKPLSRNSF